MCWYQTIDIHIIILTMREPHRFTILCIVSTTILKSKWHNIELKCSLIHADGLIYCYWLYMMAREGVG